VDPVLRGVTAADWHGYTKRSFPFMDKPCFVVEPRIAAPGKPWVWRTSWPDYHPEVDWELLHNGCHVAHIDCVDMLGCDAALDRMDRFYAQVRATWGLAETYALEAVSCGGLHAYRYAARHPGRVACLYADTPVMDLKSWPLQWPEHDGHLQGALKHYGFDSIDALKAYRGNPVDCLAPLAEARIPIRHVISLDDQVVPPGANTLEAQRRLQALGHDMEVITVARGTRSSHGHHFTLPEVFRSARFILRHAQGLPRGTEYFKLRDGLANAFDTFTRTRAGRVAFLGGSITFNGGWRDEVMRYLKKRFPGTAFEFIAAGIPSLGSVPHAFRLDKDVLGRGDIDLLFVEAAVNDATNIPDRPDLMRRGMEGVVRHARLAQRRGDVVVMHFAMPEHVACYRSGGTPVAVAQHEAVAAHYRCPSLDLARETADRILAGEFTWEGEFLNVHPSPYGQLVYANSMTRWLDAGFDQAARAAPRRHVVPRSLLDRRSYVRGRQQAIGDAAIVKGFRLDPAWVPADGVATRAGFVNVPALVADAPGAECTLAFEGTAVGLLLAAGPDAGVVAFRVDRGRWKTADTFTPWSERLHLPWALMLDDSLKKGRHTLRLRLTPQRHSKGKGTALRVLQFLVN
jgi:sialidase-1